MNRSTTLLNHQNGNQLDEHDVYVWSISLWHTDDARGESAMVVVDWSSGSIGR